MRIDVAKKEAINFIEKRPDDPIGIVIFGKDALSRAPLTLDKKVLKRIVRTINLGIINPNYTSMGTGIATAINKLKRSQSKNKIIILLTDGKPTAETDKIPIETALKLAKKFKIKIYTVAIGNKNGGYVSSSFGLVQQVPDSIDENLLKNISNQTGGQFFRANSPKEMKKIYETINRLEKTKYETSMFSKYYEAIRSFIWLPMLLLMAELILKLFLWRVL